MTGGRTSAHFSILLILSIVLIIVGFGLIASAWRILFSAQKNDGLATSGPYTWIRHPRYVGFIIVLIGSLIHWPTLLRLLMFPVLVWRYNRRTRMEEADMSEKFGDVFARDAELTSRYWPRMTATFEPVSRDPQL